MNPASPTFEDLVLAYCNTAAHNDSLFKACTEAVWADPVLDLNPIAGTSDEARLRIRATRRFTSGGRRFSRPPPGGFRRPGLLQDVGHLQGPGDLPLGPAGP